MQTRLFAYAINATPFLQGQEKQAVTPLSNGMRKT